MGNAHRLDDGQPSEVMLLEEFTSPAPNSSVPALPRPWSFAGGATTGGFGPACFVSSSLGGPRGNRESGLVRPPSRRLPGLRVPLLSYLLGGRRV